MKTVADINQEYLCTGCGTCVAICPNDAVRMEIRSGQYFPSIEYEKCTKCGKCLDVCPGVAISVNTIAEKLWPENKYDPKLGRFLATYTGYSNNDVIRYEAASGGIASAIIIYLLKNKVIDGAILTRMSKNDPLKPESFIARTEEDVLSAQTSKYLPTSPVQVVKDLKNTENEKFAFVGLPCHIHGIRKLQEKEEWVSKKIVLTVGIFCSHGVTFMGTYFLLDKLAEGSQNVSSIQYRGKGWPGGMHVTYKNNEKFNFSLDEYWPPFFSNYLFTPYRCLLCHDLGAELADISLGDAWLKDIKAKDKIGTSIIISRSKFGDCIFNKMNLEKEITIEEVSSLDVVNSQAGILARKKIGVGSRLKFIKYLSVSTPNYCQEFSFSYRGLLGSILMFFNALMSKSQRGRKILKIIPLKYLKLNAHYVHRYGSK